MDNSALQTFWLEVVTKFEDGAAVIIEAEGEAAILENVTAGTAVEELEVETEGAADAAIVVVVAAEAAEEEALEEEDSFAETARSELELEFLLSFA